MQRLRDILVRKYEFKLQPYVRGATGRRDGEDEFGFGEAIKTDNIVEWFTLDNNGKRQYTVQYRVYCTCISDNAASSQWIKMGGEKFYL